MGNSQKNSKDIFSLDQITENYDFVLVDTSALLSSMKSHGTERNGFVNHESAIFFAKHFRNNSNLYVTYSVLGEYDPTQSGYFLGYGEKDIKGGRYLSSKEINSIRKTKKRIKKTNRLVSTIQNENRILQLDKKEWKLYEGIEEKIRESCEGYGVGEVDKDLFISGAIIANTRGHSSLISNDFGIVKVWRDFLSSEGISNRQFGFFVRDSPTKFRKLHIRLIK